jgi:hypothetical protein
MLNEKAASTANSVNFCIDPSCGAGGRSMQASETIDLKGVCQFDPIDAHLPALGRRAPTICTSRERISIASAER